MVVDLSFLNTRSCSLIPLTFDPSINIRSIPPLSNLKLHSAVNLASLLSKGRNVGRLAWGNVDEYK